MDNTISQAISLPTRFAKCLNLNLPDPRSLKVGTLPSLPQKEPKSNELISHITESFELKGRLTINSQGFLYINLDDRLVFDLFEKLNQTGTEIPPYFFPEDYGAHISVVLSSEPFSIEQAFSFIDKEISFSITDCYFVKPEGWEGIRRVWFCTVHAPELSQIRTTLGLSPKISHREFHITFAIEKEFLSLDDFLSVKEDKDGRSQIEINPAESRKRKIRHLQYLSDHNLD